MIRKLHFLVPLLLVLFFSSTADAQPRRHPPRHGRPPGARPMGPPPPGFGPPCRLGGCDLNDLVNDVSGASEGVAGAETGQGTDGGSGAGESSTTGTAVADATSLSSFPNSDSYDNVQAMLQWAAEEYGLPLDLLYATAWTESRWSQWTDSGSTLVGGGVDYGLMQINETTWASTYDWTEISDDVRENIEAGADILKWSYDYAKSKGYSGERLIRATYAVYNGGPSAVGRPFTSTHQNDQNFWSNYSGRAWESNS
jgi:hypothetical protein